MDRRDAIALLSQAPATTGVCTDFDGSLSEIVDRPEEARPVRGAAEALEALARAMRVVAVVSGRSLEDLRGRFAPPGVVLAGSYGRERSDRSGPRRATEGWEAVSVAAVAATEGLPGVVVERKGAGVALHYRLAPEHAQTVAALAEDLASTFDLELRPGRLVVELVRPGPGKGDAVRALVAEHELTVCLFGGDDAADLEAFRALRELACETVLVAVASEESPPGLTAEADLVVRGPRGYADFLTHLAREATRRRG